MGFLERFFVHPALLWGGLAIAAPIIIFLLTRYRYKTIEWAALTFLLRAFKRQQRRLRLENLLLLLLRCLLLLLLAMVVARPRAGPRADVNEKDKRHNVVVMLDTSYSTGYQLGSDDEETVYERERRAAKEIVAGLRDGDRLLVLAFDEAVRVLDERPQHMDEQGRREVSQELDDALEVRRSSRGTDLAEALHALPRLLGTFDLGADGLPPPEGTPPLKKTVFLLTDAQRRGLLDASGQLVDPSLARAAHEIEQLGTTLVLVDCGDDDPQNVSVVYLGSREPVVGQDIPCHIECTVRNWSGVPAQDLLVEYTVDGAPTPQKTVSLSVAPDEERAPEPLRTTFQAAGPHTVEVVVRSDALQVDNRRAFVVDVRPSVTVVLVDGERQSARWESETDFVAAVLALSEHSSDDRLGLVRPDVVSEAALLGRDLTDVDVVLMCNVATPAEEVVAALERYVRAGGTVVFTLGANVDPAFYNEQLWRRGAGLFPCRLVEVRGGTRDEAQQDLNAPAWVMAVADTDHAVVGVFADDEMTPHLKGPSIFGFVVADATEAPGAPPAGATVPLRVVTRQADERSGARPEVGDAFPLLVERPFGRGEVVVWTSTADYAWNTCVLYDGFFVPFWRQLVLHLAQRSRPPLNLAIGSHYERLLRTEEYSASIEIETPGGQQGERVVLERVEGEGLYRLVYPSEEERAGLQESGVYTITRRPAAGDDAEPRVEHFGVTIRTDEGDLARYSAEELQEALGIQVRSVSPDGVREALVEGGGVLGERQFWRHALAAVLVLLVLESTLAAIFGRGRR